MLTRIFPSFKIAERKSWKNLVYKKTCQTKLNNLPNFSEEFPVNIEITYNKSFIQLKENKV